VGKENGRAPGGSLGKTTRFASPPGPAGVVETAAEAATGQVAERRIGRYRLQNAAARLLPEERVAKCMRTVLEKGGSVAVMHSREVGRAHYKGLMCCGSLWTCPVCASKISERRRVELSKALERNPEYSVVLATFTFAHGQGDALAELVDFLNDGIRRTRSGEPWLRIQDRFCLVGSIRRWR
jgi:hypothetical protein